MWCSRSQALYRINFWVAHDCHVEEGSTACWFHRKIPCNDVAKGPYRAVCPRVARYKKILDRISQSCFGVEKNHVAVDAGLRRSNVHHPFRNGFQAQTYHCTLLYSLVVLSWENFDPITAMEKDLEYQAVTESCCFFRENSMMAYSTRDETSSAPVNGYCDCRHV